MRGIQLFTHRRMGSSTDLALSVPSSLVQAFLQAASSPSRCVAEGNTNTSVEPVSPDLFSATLATVPKWWVTAYNKPITAELSRHHAAPRESQHLFLGIRLAWSGLVRLGTYRDVALVIKVRFYRCCNTTKSHVRTFAERTRGRCPSSTCFPRRF
ncbi:hypothetical protein F5B22DRAFT_304173 [Xylaria bambusicola]|uniref:uncharacterized protein n=1 Tax=Xylaria bambusicola TaxID=326684 RepID=UPI002008D472|nr:uncharacterized protein F5B22DRAFT_304173 [Xylaria bambusicola]KAI0512473.1 hypothetical protein F5B22DRAFT_304173 [Xylaria bambusicola]